jgi:hypothetical protein
MKARFVKLPLDGFIKQLVELYEMGVDYVDLVGESDAVQDFIEIHFTNEYMSPEMRANFEELDDDTTFSDEDLNQII